ncbi:MAG TPA: M56 family metallopeptidase [Gemmatimonadaceae bacterium]|nr:M56 family metallopeptidase [Gemmatimonadaceae bacterium]
MTGNVSSTALAWLLTYAIHSTVLLAIVWLLARTRRLSPGASELLWKSAMIGAIVTTSLQLSLDVRPAGTVVLGDGGWGMGDGGSGVRDAVHASPSALAAQPATSQVPHPSSRIPHPAVLMQTGSEPASQRPGAITTSSAAVFTWALVAMILGLTYVARRLILVGRLGDRRDVSDGPMFELLIELAGDAGVPTIPRLTSTSRISSPVALGIDEICVPETALTELDLDQQRSLLAHELAHLTRRDPVWLIVGSLIERVLWIQPLNRIANREIATSAEFLCDDWAVHRTGSGLPLARCLAQVAEWIQASPLGVPVAGMAEERSLLVSRVSRLVDDYKPATKSRRGLAVGASAVLVGTILVAPGVSGKAASTLLADEIQTTRSVGPTASEGVSTTVATPPSAQVATASSQEPVARPDTNADTGVVSALIERLGDENAEVRSAAARSLGHIKDSRAVPGLIGALKDRDPKVRESAAEALSEFEDPRAITPLADLLNDPSSDVKKSALEALSHFDSNLPSTAIVRLLNDPDDDVRHNAAHLVGKMRDRSATRALSRLIADRNADVREAAIDAIAELGDPTAVIALMPALSDPNPDVRERALSAIDDLKAPIPAETLVNMMHDRDADVRERAAQLAGDRSLVAAVPALRRLLDDPNADVRERAVESLGNIPDGAAYDALRAALTSKDAKVRRAAAEALGDRR